MQGLYQTIVVREGAELEGKALNLPVVYVSTLTYGHNLWIVI